MPDQKWTARRYASLTSRLVLCACPLVAACATAGSAPDRGDIGEALRTRTGQTIRQAADADAPAFPPDVSLDDGLTADEAVAVALWNSPAFAASLADLGLARADLVEAQLLRNPIFSLLFPLGPKQLEWTLQLPVEALWQRPRRVAAAALSAQAVGQRLVSEGLTLVADVRQAYIDAVAAGRRVALTEANTDLARRIADIADARLRAGDISDLEARAARSDALQMDAALLARRFDRDLAAVMLASRMGLDLPADRLTLLPAAGLPSGPCDTADGLLEEALAARPDIRAAEIGVEAAGQRASWERSKILSLIATLDANGQGDEGFEMGPGLVADLPVFSRNQGAVARAAAEIERAGRTYVAVRMQVMAEVRAADLRFAQARRSILTWQQDIIPSLEIEQRQAESAYREGEIALLSLLDASRRLGDARLRHLEAEIDLQKAGVLLDRSVGRTCTPL